MSAADKGMAVLIKDVTFTWQSGEPIVIDITDFQIKRGEQLFLYGPSGCGKSTLLSLLSGIVAADIGFIEVLGQNMSALKGAARDDFRASHIGVIFQQFNLLPFLSVIDNVILGCGFSDQRKKSAAGKHNLKKNSLKEEAIRLLLHLGLTGDILERPAAKLSVGQQQRVAAARALIGAPELILADEPTSALDTAARQDFLGLLKAECMAQGTSLIFVSHDMSLAEHFDRSLDLTTLNLMAGNIMTDHLKPIESKQCGEYNGEF